MSMQLLVLVVLSITCTICTSYTSLHRGRPARPRTTRLDAESTSAAAVMSMKRTAPSDVVSMFDDFAPSFEAKLVDVLEYSAPQDVATAASERIRDDRRGKLYGSALDAGCGTGLSGPHLRGLVNGPLAGIDLSPKMAELAAELVVDDGPIPVAKDRMRRCAESARLAIGADNTPRLYDGVFTGDLLDLSNPKFMDGYGLQLTNFPDTFDLIVSADVLCYFGELGGVLQELTKKLAPGGDLIFSTETIAEGDYNWIRQPSDRYAHCPNYVARMAADAGLARVSQIAFTPRMESGEKVLGTLHTFHKQTNSS